MPKVGGCFSYLYPSRDTVRRDRDTVRDAWWGLREHETETHMQRQQKKNRRRWER